jgi:hypothetical protein
LTTGLDVDSHCGSGLAEGRTNADLTSYIAALACPTAPVMRGYINRLLAHNFLNVFIDLVDDIPVHPHLESGRETPESKQLIS